MSKELKMIAAMIEALEMPNLVIEIDGEKCLNYDVMPDGRLEQRMNLTIKTLKKVILDFLNITSYCNHPNELSLFERLDAGGCILASKGRTLGEAIERQKHEQNILKVINGFFDLVREHIDPDCPLMAGSQNEDISDKIISEGGNA